jgi:hypothetical protein
MAGTTSGHTSAQASERIILPILSSLTGACVRQTAACVSITVRSVTFYTVPTQRPSDLEATCITVR